MWLMDLHLFGRFSVLRTLISIILIITKKIPSIDSMQVLLYKTEKGIFYFF
jgi:hypothetical protein